MLEKYYEQMDQFVEQKLCAVCDFNNLQYFNITDR